MKIHNSSMWKRVTMIVTTYYSMFIALGSSQMVSKYRMIFVCVAASEHRAVNIYLNIDVISQYKIPIKKLILLTCPHLSFSPFIQQTLYLLCARYRVLVNQSVLDLYRFIYTVLPIPLCVQLVFSN